MWPFGKRRRAEDVGATDLVDVSTFADQTSTVLDQQYQAAVGSVVDVSMSSALEVARSLVARSFAAAEVLGVDDGMLGPSTMAAIGRLLIWPGESVYVLLGARLYPVASFDVRGGVGQLKYRMEVSSPEANLQVVRDQRTVLHFKNVVGTDWWRGGSPLSGALATGQLASRIDVMLRDEGSGIHGYMIPTSENPASEEMQKVVSDLRDLRGRSMLVQSVLRGVGGDAPAPRDWKAERLGFNPPEALLKAREAVFRSVLGILGVPPSLFLGEGGDGGAGREAWRRFLHGTVEPMGRQVEVELRRVFGMDVRISFGRMMAHDVAGQARAVHVLTQSGVDLETALRLSGFSQ